MNKKQKQHKLNQEIKTSEVRVTEDGIMSLQDALTLAESRYMDLVLINDNAQPPICKIMNYDKFLYEQSKKPKNKTLEIKEIKLGPNTADNDLEYRTKHIIEFLQKGHRVKLSLQFRGREIVYVDKGKALMLKLILSVEQYGTPESMPTLEGKKMFCTLKPKTNK